ncbi:MAG: DeoR family transcriptional regulator, partial [Clostridium sp.]
MTKQERQKAILALLQEKGELHVQTICRNFHIVAMTARRDLM